MRRLLVNRPELACSQGAPDPAAAWSVRLGQLTSLLPAGDVPALGKRGRARRDGSSAAGMTGSACTSPPGFPSAGGWRRSVPSASSSDHIH